MLHHLSTFTNELIWAAPHVIIELLAADILCEKKRLTKASDATLGQREEVTFGGVPFKLGPRVRMNVLALP